MSRFVCTGDLHLGAGSDYSREPGDRLADQRATLEQIAAIAQEHHVDAILFAGDAFEGPTVSPEQYAAFQAPLRNLGVPVIAITGNGKHDCAMRQVKAPEVVADVAEIFTLPATRVIGDTAVCMLPWSPVSRLVAARDGGQRDEINQDVADLLLQIAGGLHANIEAKHKVLMLHWSIEGAALPNGLPINQHAREPILPLHELEQLGFDAIVAGHIHRPQRLESPAEAEAGVRPVFYVGSPLQLNFGEQHEHGVWLLDTGLQRLEFLQLQSRRFVTVDVDLAAGGPEQIGLDETEAVAAAVAMHADLHEAVVRVRYRATGDQARRIDWDAIRSLLDNSGTHKLYGIGGEIVRANRARVESIDEELEPLTAVDLWLAANQVNGWEGESLRELTSRYLEATGA